MTELAHLLVLAEVGLAEAQEGQAQAELRADGVTTERDSLQVILL